MKNIAIIPARSGSKGLKNKNIKLLNGKPLLAYTIEAAKKSKCFDTIFVSTDSKKYAEIAKQYGAEVPFLRSKQNSSDTAGTWDTVKEVLDCYKKLGKEFDNFMLLQPTSPLRTYKDIKNAFELLKEKKANSIVSVCESSISPEQLYLLPSNKLISDEIEKKTINKRRQEINKRYFINGAIYLSKIDYFLKRNNIYEKKCFAYVMDKEKSIDIDDKYDFARIEGLLKK